MQIQFARVEGIDLPESKRFVLSDGMMLLTRQNNDLLTNGELGSVSYQLYYDETQELPVYADELGLPVEDLNLIRLIEEELTEDGESLSPDIQIFLSALSQELEGTTKKKKKKPSENRKRDKKIKNIESPPVIDEPVDAKEIEEVAMDEPISVVPVKKKVAKNPKNTVQKTQKKTLKKIKPSILKNRNVFLILGVFLLMLIIGGLCFNYFSSTTAQEKPTYSELMKKGYYLEAGKEYPDKQAAIEQVLYDKIVDSKDKKNKDALLQFQKVYPTPFGKFDLAILETDYAKALKEYEREKSDFKGSQDRLVLVGYCYLKTDQLSEAKRLVDETKSPELERYVYKYEQKQDEIKSLEKTLTELKKNPVDNKNEIEKTMNALFDAKEELLNL